jgi:hypothetical protein
VRGMVGRGEPAPASMRPAAGVRTCDQRSPADALSPIGVLPASRSSSHDGLTAGSCFAPYVKAGQATRQARSCRAENGRLAHFGPRRLVGGFRSGLSDTLENPSLARSSSFSPHARSPRSTGNRTSSLSAYSQPGRGDDWRDRGLHVACRRPGRADGGSRHGLPARRRGSPRALRFDSPCCPRRLSVWRHDTGLEPHTHTERRLLLALQHRATTPQRSASDQQQLPRLPFPSSLRPARPSPRPSCLPL